MLIDTKFTHTRQPDLVQAILLIRMDIFLLITGASVSIIEDHLCVRGTFCKIGHVQNRSLKTIPLLHNFKHGFYSRYDAEVYSVFQYTSIGLSDGHKI